MDPKRLGYPDPVGPSPTEYVDPNPTHLQPALVNHAVKHENRQDKIQRVLDDSQNKIYQHPKEKRPKYTGWLESPYLQSF